MKDIAVKNISKAFGGKVVLKNFSADFPYGSVTCIMGRSGCGKTTLLNIIMGLIPPDDGEITGKELNFSAVFQEDRLLDGFSPAANIKICCGKLIPDKTVHEHLDKVGLSGTEDKTAQELSGGMRRRLAIVRSVLADSDVIILDEPFKGLDDETKALVIEYFLSNRRGRTVIMVTHDINEAAIMNGITINMEGFYAQAADSSGK